MKATDSAVKLLKATESELRTLMQAALAEARYDDLAAIAPFAAGLAGLLYAKSPNPNEAGVFENERLITPNSPLNAPPPNVTDEPPTSNAKRGTAKGDDYPKFEQDGDKLVKIGWSKKDRREYEHRTPFIAVLRVADVLRNRVVEGKVFAMENLIPFTTESGQEIPTYQSYLAMAWFRAIGAVEQCGKEGYRLVPHAIEKNSLGRAYDSLPKH